MDDIESFGRSQTVREKLTDLDDTAVRIVERLPEEPGSRTRKEPLLAVTEHVPDLGQHHVRPLRARQPLRFSHLLLGPPSSASFRPRPSARFGPPVSRVWC